MSIEVWPFLVSRNRYLDYRTVVAPDFIYDAKISNLLARVAEGELTDPGKGIMRNITGSKAGDFTIVFRVIKATERDINTGGNKILKDQFGREIYIFEGIVIVAEEEEIIESFNISDDDFQKLHKRLIAEYKKFWSLVNPTPATPSQQSFTLDTENVTNPLVLEKLELFDLRSKTPTPEPEKIKLNPKISSRKIPVTLFLPPVIILIFVIGLIFRKALFGETISLGCATTLEKEIIFETGEKISDKLKEEKKKYPEKADIYLSGSLKIESSKNIENKEFSSKSEKQPTIKLSEDSKLEMNYHPIDLAITDMKNQKLDEKSRNPSITLRLIDRSGCVDHDS